MKIIRRKYSISVNKTMKLKYHEYYWRNIKKNKNLLKFNWNDNIFSIFLLLNTTS